MLGAAIVVGTMQGKRWQVVSDYAMRMAIYNKAGSCESWSWSERESMWAQIAAICSRRGVIGAGGGVAAGTENLDGEHRRVVEA